MINRFGSVFLILCQFFNNKVGVINGPATKWHPSYAGRTLCDLLAIWLRLACDRRSRRKRIAAPCDLLSATRLALLDPIASKSQGFDMLNPCDRLAIQSQVNRIVCDPRLCRTWRKIVTEWELLNRIEWSLAHFSSRKILHRAIWDGCKSGYVSDAHFVISS